MDATASSTLTTADSTSSTYCRSLSTEDLALSVGNLQEYETQLLGFTPKAFCDGIHNAVLEHTFKYLEATCYAVSNEFPESAATERSHRVLENLFLSVQKKIAYSFDKLENYLLTNIFHIPSDVVLPEDLVQQAYRFTQEDNAQIEKEIADIKENILSEKFMEATLKEELKQLSKSQSLYLDILQSMNDVDKECLKSGVSDIKECLEFTNRTAQRLNQLMEKHQDYENKKDLENEVSSRSKDVDL